MLEQTVLEQMEDNSSKNQGERTVKNMADEKAKKVEDVKVDTGADNKEVKAPENNSSAVLANLAKNLQHNTANAQTNAPTTADASKGDLKTSEFTGPDGEAKDTKVVEIPTKDTEGVTEFVQIPTTPMNRLPAVDGEIAKEPYITFKKIAGGINKVPVLHGIFRKNEDGKEVPIIDVMQNSVDPVQLAQAQLQAERAQKAAKSAAKRLVSENTRKLQSFMYEHSFYIFGTTARDNQPMAAVNIKKGKDDLQTSVSFKVRESGVGSILLHYILVPSRAYDAFQSSEAYDDEVTDEIVKEKTPERKIVCITRDTFTTFVGMYLPCRLRVLPQLSDPNSATKMISEDPAMGVVEEIVIENKPQTYMETDTSDKAIAYRKRMNERREKLQSAGRTEVEMILTLRCVPRNTARRTLISPTNYIPKKTQHMIPAGSSFIPSRDGSPAEMTEIYLTAPIKKSLAGGNNTFASLVTGIAEPTKEKPFLFVPQAQADGIGENPVFYRTETPAYVEPFFPTLQQINGAWVAKKIPTTPVTRIVKKVQSKNGSYVVDGSLITDESGYDMSYYNRIAGKFKAVFGSDVQFPTISELRAAMVRQSTSSKSSQSRKINEFISPFEQAVAQANADTTGIIMDLDAAKRNLNELKKHGPKVPAWRRQWNTAKRKVLEDAEAI